jgi:hypothetical protein
MRRRIGDVLVSIGALALLLLALVSVDDRVREQVSLRLAAPPSAQMATVEARARDLTAIVFAAVRDQSLAHAPLMIFVLAATVLFLFMVRT